MNFKKITILIIALIILFLFWKNNSEKKNFKNSLVEIICLAEEIEKIEKQKMIAVSAEEIGALENKIKEILDKYGFQDTGDIEKYFQKHMKKYKNDEELVMEIEIMAEEKCGFGLNSIDDIEWNTRTEKF